MSPKILFGPYGTRLEQKAETQGFTYEEPTDLLGNPPVAQALGDIADEYLDAGARAVTIPCFGARWSLHKKQGGIQEYRQLTERSLSIVLARLELRSQQLRDNISLLFSVGPMNDCYSPNEAPSLQESAEFHEQQIRQIDELSKKYQVQITALFETLPSGEEAEGIARALKSFHKGETQAWLSYPFTSLGKPLGDESFSDIINRVDAHQNGLRIQHGFNCGPIEGLHYALHSLKKQRDRVSIIYPNASSKPHAELNNVGVNHGLIDSQQTAAYLRFLSSMVSLSVLGGCCGYDNKNISHLVSGKSFQEEFPPTDRLPRNQKV